MNRYRESTAASSRATPQTLCQKCLKKDRLTDSNPTPLADSQARHYSYECKAAAQERPYISRPSRTQQLANPKLVPKLTSDVPNDLLRKKGIADEELARKEADRGRKRKLDEDELMNGSRKRSRSVSSYSTNSVSTLSTNLSRSSSPKRAGDHHTGHSQLLSHLEVDRKRRRSRSSSMSYTSDSSHGGRRRDRPRNSFRDSPRKRTQHQEQRGTGGQRRRHARPRSMSYVAESSPEKSRPRPSHNQDRSKRRRHSSRSPIDRGRDSFSNRGSRRTRSPSESRDRSQVIRNRKSMTPGLSRRDDGHRPASDRGESYYSRDNDRYGSSARYQQEDIRGTRPLADAPPSRKERSLSPFSKRLALTQAMNMGR